MRFFLAIFLLMTVFLAAGTIFLAMHNHMDCISHTVEHEECSTTGNILDFLAFHLGMLMHASWAVFGVTITGGLLLVAFSRTQSILQPLQVLAINELRAASVLLPSPTIQLLSWLGLHEKRDPRFA